MPIQFTHLIGGKKLTIFDKKAVAGMIHGVCTSPTLKTEVETVFLIIDKCPTPLPILETEAQVLALMATNTETK